MLLLGNGSGGQLGGRTVRTTLALAALVALGVAGCSSEDSGKSGQALCDHSVTAYPGDCMRLKVPAANEGMQFHYGPDTYTTEAMKPFLLDPGMDYTDILYKKSQNADQVYFNRYSSRLRPGAHHFIVAAGDRNYTDGLFQQTLPPLDFDMLLGTQSGGVDVPTPGEPIAPEDQNLVFTMEPLRQLALNAHFINTTNKPILREAWVNLYFAPPDVLANKQIAAPIFFNGGLAMAIQPHTHVVLKNSVIVPQDLRIVWLFGHFHTHTLRESAYIQRQGSTDRQLIYETYDYHDPLYVGYNSIIQTNPPDPVNRIAGASSGILLVKQGDSVQWECEIQNDDEFVLNFANELTTAEMCCLFGLYTPSTDGKAWSALVP